MNKVELVKVVADKTGLTQKEVNAVVEKINNRLSTREEAME